MTYTVIKAHVEDQRLIITNLPKLSSGGYNETRVEFTFCSRWTGFTKTAVFYTDKGRVYYILVENNIAVVPHEVLANEGILHFGVFGYSADQARTTDMIQLPIVEGAITDSTAIHIAPTPDVYQQLLRIAMQVEEGIYTPKKGVDYWTAADKAEMINAVLANFTDASEVAL